MGTIAEKLAAVASSKAAIGTAIEGRGGTVPTKLSDYGTAVAALPNTYAAGDEGKVVSNGALVSQTSLTITENNTYDTTTKNSVTVNVSGGGGGGPFLEVVTRQASPTWTVSASDLAGATSIGNSAFYGCSGLTGSLTIPDSVTSIGDSAFYGCSNLATVDFDITRSTIPTLANVNAFGSLPANYQIWVPGELLATWKNTENWIDLASHICPYQAIDGGECVSEGNGVSIVGGGFSGTFDANAAFNIDSEGVTMFSENSTLWIGDSIHAIDDSGFGDDFGGPMYNDGQNNGCWGYLKFCNIPQEEVETWSGYPWGFPTNRISYLSRPE